jgi:hypothetical protein
MGILEMSGAYCSSFICAGLPVGLLLSFGGNDVLCTFWEVLKARVKLMVEVC